MMKNVKELLLKTLYFKGPWKNIGLLSLIPRLLREAITLPEHLKEFLAASYLHKNWQVQI